MAYSFNEPNRTYEWHVRNWTSCSVPCGVGKSLVVLCQVSWLIAYVTGTQSPLYECRQRMGQSVVNNALCSGEPVRNERDRYCNAEKCGVGL